MRFIFLFLICLSFISSAQNWSDSLDLNESSKYIYYDSLEGKFGYTQSGKVVIKPKFDAGFSFHSKLATVKTNGKWGAINKKGRWKIAPSYDLMSTIINGQYLAEKESVFYWKTVSGKVLYSGDFFKIDYLKLLNHTKKSQLEDKELIIRVLEMEISRFNICGSEEDHLKRKSTVYSHLLIHRYYFTKLFMGGSLSTK